MRCCLEEQFRPLGVIDAVVEVSATRALRLFHASIATAVVGDSGRPDLLAANGRQHICERRAINRPRASHQLIEMSNELFARDQLVPRRCRNLVKGTAFFCYNSLPQTVKFHARKYLR